MMNVAALRPLYFEDIKVGMRETLMRTVMDEDVVGFAELTGDHNPVHLSDLYAQTTVFGQRIAHGLYTASLISAILGTKLPGPGRGLYFADPRIPRPGQNRRCRHD